MRSQGSLSVRVCFVPTIHSSYSPHPAKLALPCSTRSVVWAIGLGIIHSSNRAAVPHRSMNDDQYRGYDIPANTVIIPNVWSVCPSILVLFLTSSRRRAMTRDEQVYPDAHKFNPERFLNQNGPETDPKDFVFGFGRRQAASHSFFLAPSSEFSLQGMSGKSLRGRERVDSCGLHNCCVPGARVAQRTW